MAVCAGGALGAADADDAVDVRGACDLDDADADIAARHRI